MLSKQTPFAQLIIPLILSAIISPLLSLPVAFPDFTCSNCPGTTAGVGCRKSYISADLPNYVGANQSTIAVWAKFSTPLNDQNTNIFLLGRKSVSNPGYPMSYYRYQSMYLFQNKTVFTSQAYTYENSFGPPIYHNTTFNHNFELNRWYFFYSSVDFSGLFNTQGYYGFYNPNLNLPPASWTKWIDNQLWSNQPFENDIMLSFGVFDSNYMQSYPCVSFSGAYASPAFVQDPNVVYRSLGLYKAHVIILYVFDEKDNGLILDRSGNSFDGVLGLEKSDGTVDTTVAPSWNASDGTSISNGATFKGEHTIISRSFPVSQLTTAAQIIGVHMQVKIMASPSSHCNPTKTNNVILFQLLYNTDTSSAPVFVFGVNYQINGAFHLFLNNSQGQSTHFSDQYSVGVWTDIIVFCGEHSRSGQFKPVCTVYVDGFQTYSNVFIPMPSQMTTNSNLTFKLGDEKTSFCGSVKKFLVFSNTTYLTIFSGAQKAICSMTLGFVSPICLSTYKGKDVCKVGDYYNSADHSCSKCSPGCFSCTSFENCFVCNSSFKLINQKRCEENKAILPCPSNCRECSSSTSCSVCHHGYYLSEGACYDDCKRGQYYNQVSQQCENCDSSCETCSGPLNTDCESCKSPRVLFNQQCRVNCPPYSTYDAEDGKCVYCDPTCLSCNKTGCTLCPNGKFLFQGMCFHACPGGYYQATSPTLPGPICVPKNSSEMTLQLTTSPTTFLVTCNGSNEQLLTELHNRLSVSVGQHVLNQSNFTTEVMDKRTIMLTLNLESYVPQDTILTVKLNLPSGYNKNPNHAFYFPTTSATISMKEIALLSNSSAQTITEVSAASNSLSNSLSTVQTANLVKSAGVSTSVMRLQFSIQTFQMARHIEAHYPPLIRKYFETSDSDSFIISSGFFSSSSIATSSSSSNVSTNRRLLVASSTSNTSEAAIGSKTTNETFIKRFDAQISIGIIILFAGIVVYSLANLFSSSSSSKEPSSSWKRRIFIILKFADWLFNFNLTIVYFSFIQFTGVYYGMTEISNSVKGIQNPLSLAVAVAYLAFNILLIMCTYCMATSIKTTTNKKTPSPASKAKRKSETNPKPSQISPRIAFITAEYKTNNRLQTLYVPFMLTRIFITALLLALLTNLPCLQASLVLAINVGFLLYSILLRPLLNRCIMALTIGTEILVTTGSVCTVILTVINSTEETLNSRNFTGIVFICCSVGVSITGLIISFVQIVNTIINLKRHCQKKGSSLSKWWQNLEQEYQKHAEGRGISYEEVDGNKKTAEVQDPNEYAIENIWGVWRKSVAVISQDEWTKPENLEKLYEIINWAKDLMPEQKSQENQHVTIDGLGFEILKQLNDCRSSASE